MSIIKEDEFPLECRISIDLEKKKVNFEHLIEKKGRFWIANNLIFPTLQTLGFICCLMLVPIIYCFPIIGFLELYLGEEYTTISLLLIVLPSFIFLFFLFLAPLFSFILTFIPNFNSKIFPKIGAVCHALTGNKTDVLVTKIENNVFEVPMFSNAFITYKCLGDFNNCLKKINIIEHPFHYMLHKKRKRKFNRCTHWRALFYFSRNPKYGAMEVSYL